VLVMAEADEMGDEVRREVPEKALGMINGLSV
jgi:hypothetical protein